MSTIARQTWKERGMVSILVTMLLMVVISLIVLGFAQISRRNQRQALDRQLSTQAFYAAETGVNDARDLISTALASGSTVPEKPDCTAGSGAAALFYAGLNPAIDAANNVSYTCVMVDPDPTLVQFGDVGTTSTIVPVRASSGTIASIKLAWQSKDTSSTPTAGCPASANAAFSPTASWSCGYGVLRMDLVPTGGSLSLSGLQSSTMTSFLVPVPSSATTSIPYPGAPASSSNTNNRVATRCTNSGCEMTITGLTSGQYHLRVMSLYKNVTLQVSALTGAGTAVPLQGVQAVVDVTGKAQDVLRRIQVRVPLAQTSSQLPDYALQTTDAICKRFAAMDGYFQSSAVSALPGLTSITVPPNPMCQ